MTSTMTLAPRAGEDPSGLVGDRDVVCLQTINIGRLRSDPVPLTPATFIAVTGRGPKGDSNGSGKTTFLGALSLLLGDIGWHPASGCPEAATLLFDGTKAGAAVERYGGADHGYVIAVFARVEGTDPMTVWLRVSAVAPYMKVRAADGMHLVERATSSTARDTAADSVWNQLPKPEWGSRTYAAQLYGPSPRCMAWLQVRGNEVPGQSLLKLAQENLTPLQIGTALLELLGRNDLLVADSKARQDLDETTRELERHQEADVRQRLEEDAELKAIDGRNHARKHTRTARHLWRLHYAKGLVDATERVADARQEVLALGPERREARIALARTRLHIDTLGDGEGLRLASEEADEKELKAHGALQRAQAAKVRAQDSVAEAIETFDQLKVEAAGWDDTSLSDAEALEEEAAIAVEEATRRAGAAESRRKEAENALRAAELGSGGAVGDTLARLSDVCPGAVGLADAIDLLPGDREVWEARLALFADAVVVPDESLEQATRAAAAGDVLITGPADDGPLPSGILSAPRGASGFLRHIAGTPATGLPPSAHPIPHVTVVGGFEQPSTGAGARIGRARTALGEAIEQEQRVERGLLEAQQVKLQAERRRLAASAASDLVTAERALEDARSVLATASGIETESALAHREARTSKTDADTKWGGYQSERSRLLEALRHDEQALTHASQELKQAVDRVRRRRDNLRYWTLRWQGDPQSAREALTREAEQSPKGEDRSSIDAYRRAANHALDRALTACGIDVDTGEGAPPGSSIALAVDATAARRAPATPDDEGARQIYEQQSAAFHDLVEALDDWLTGLQVADTARAAHVAADRLRRAEAMAAVEELCTSRLRDLPILQDGIERTIRTTLAAVSQRLDELDRDAKGVGADLKIDVRRPATAKESWEWHVTPRYRRGRDGPLVPYTERANTATEKLLAINLVLAALFAATSGRENAQGRVLILDELGDSLGDYHRDAVLRALSQTAKTAGITVLGTCQDGVLEDAAEHSGLMLYFQFRDESDILNAPTRVFGSSEGGLVELTGPFIERLG